MKVSVYVPVYNGENTIESCINSLLSQTKNFDEIIIAVATYETDNERKIKLPLVPRYPSSYFIKIYINAVLNNNTIKCDKVEGFRIVMKKLFTLFSSTSSIISRRTIIG